VGTPLHLACRSGPVDQVAEGTQAEGNTVVHTPAVEQERQDDKKSLEEADTG